MTRRLAHTLLRSVAWLVAVLVLLTAALGWRLLSAPLSLAWLTPAIERALTPADGDFHVEIERTELRRGADRLIELIGYEVRGQAPDGRVLFALPEIELNLSLSALVLHGVVAPERIHAIAPSLGLVRRADGSIGLRVSKDETAAAPQVTPKVLIGPFMSSDPDEPLAYLDSLNISGGRLVIYDEARGRSLMARNAEFVLERRPAGVNAAVSFEIGQPQGPARIAVTGIYRRGSDHIGFIADVKRLSILPLAAFAPEIPLAGIDLTLDGRLTGALSLDGALSTVGFEVSAEDGRIERPDVLSRALPVDTLEVKGATQRDLKEVVIDSFEVTSSGTSLEGSGRLVRSAAGAGLSAELRAENVPAADLDLYWPPELGEKARKWVLENITAGIAPHAEATLEFAPGELEERPVPEASVHGRFAFHNLTVGYFKTLPPLEGVDGSATFTARRMDIDVARGHVGNLEVSKGSAVITGMGIKGRDTTQLEVAAEIAGPIQEALALIDHEPLGFASKIGIEPQATAGRTEVDLRIGVPLHKDLEPSEVRVQAKAQLHDAAISKLRERFDVDGGELELSVDRASAELSGSARVDGVPLEIDWQENLADDAALERSFHLQGDVPADALARFGIEPPLPVQGSFGLGARVEETAGRRQVYLALDLEPLAFSLPWLAWQKARGQEGRLDAVLAIPEEGPIGVESFSVSGPDLNIMGTMQLQAEPLALISADIESFRLARSQGSLVVQSDPEGTYRVKVEALSLDLGRLLEMRDQATSKEPSGGPSGEPTPFRLELSADTVLLDGQSLRAVHADLARDRSGWRSADVDARLSSGGTVALRLVPENGQRHLTVTSGDAGALLEALDQSSRIEGGRLKIDAVIRRQVPTLAAEGIFQVKDFKLLDAPALARLLTLASLTGIGNLLGGEGIFFDRLELPFTLQDRVITIDEGRMSGSQLGLTAEGRIELDPARLELDGTIVPVYTLNKVIGNIPLLGPFLTGSEGEGAFAATYTLRGDPGEPEITVNPLSVLAPGFLRELFSGLLSGSLQPPEVRPDDK